MIDYAPQHPQPDQDNDKQESIIYTIMFIILFTIAVYFDLL